MPVTSWVNRSAPSPDIIIPITWLTWHFKTSDLYDISPWLPSSWCCCQSPCHCSSAAGQRREPGSTSAKKTQPTLQFHRKKKTNQPPKPTEARHHSSSLLYLHPHHWAAVRISLRWGAGTPPPPAPTPVKWPGDGQASGLRKWTLQTHWAPASVFLHLVNVCALGEKRW